MAQLSTTRPTTHPSSVKRAVCLVRSGALGDFVLTLPLLLALHRAGRPVRLATRRAYFPLLEGSGWEVECRTVEDVELGQLAGRPPPALVSWLRGADVLSFWPDPDGAAARAAAACGAQSYRVLPSRPERPPHAVLQILQAAGVRADETLLRESPLGFQRRTPPKSGALWLHPGSGSASKNAPLAAFAALARAWAGPVVVSLGEAEIEDRSRYAAAFDGSGAELALAPALAELRDRIAAEAALFVGNDTGPTHLAAALGVPTKAVFVQTDPEIWRPVGERVEVVRDLRS